MKNEDVDKLVEQADHGMRGLGSLGQITKYYGDRLERRTNWLLGLTIVLLIATLALVGWDIWKK